MSKKNKKKKRVAKNKYAQFSRAPSKPGGETKQQGLQGNKERRKGKSTRGEKPKSKPPTEEKPTVSSPIAQDKKPGIINSAEKKSTIIIPAKPKLIVPPVQKAHPSGSAAILVDEFDEKLW